MLAQKIRLLTCERICDARAGEKIWSLTCERLCDESLATASWCSFFAITAIDTIRAHVHPWVLFKSSCCTSLRQDSTSLRLCCIGYEVSSCKMHASNVSWLANLSLLGALLLNCIINWDPNFISYVQVHVNILIQAYTKFVGVVKSLWRHWHVLARTLEHTHEPKPGTQSLKSILASHTICLLPLVCLLSFFDERMSNFLPPMVIKTTNNPAGIHFTIMKFSVWCCMHILYSNFRPASLIVDIL